MKKKKTVIGGVRIPNVAKPKIEIRRVAVVLKAEVYSDVLERIDGYEDYAAADTEYANVIYRMGTLTKILTDPEDDTNETTKYRIENLVKKIGKNVDYVMIVS